MCVCVCVFAPEPLHCSFHSASLSLPFRPPFQVRQQNKYGPVANKAAASSAAAAAAAAAMPLGNDGGAAALKVRRKKGRERGEQQERGGKGWVTAPLFHPSSDCLLSLSLPSHPSLTLAPSHSLSLHLSLCPPASWPYQGLVERSDKLSSEIKKLRADLSQQQQVRRGRL